MARIERVVRMLPATPETFEMLQDEMLLYSLSLTPEQRIEELNELKRMFHPEPFPSAKVFRGFRKLTDPDPFD